MITRNRIKFSEKQAALIWQQVAGRELTSTEDELVSVIYPGRTNGDNGPDFRDAVIVNKSRLTKGDVEVHVILGVHVLGPEADLGALSHPYVGDHGIAGDGAVGNRYIRSAEEVNSIAGVSFCDDIVYFDGSG
jgi:hypothetical protein